MAYSSNIEETMVLLRRDIDLLKNQADDVMPTPMKLEKIKLPWVNRSVENQFKTSGTWGSKKLVTSVEQVQSKLSAAYNIADTELAAIVAEHEANIPAIENNTKIREKVRIFMTRLGIHEGYTSYEFKTSRSSKRTSIPHISGFVSDLQRVVPVSDGFDGVERACNEYKRKLKDYADKLIQQINKDTREKEKAEKDKKKLKVFATLCVKYDLDIESEANDIRDAILAKDKYLHLAYWLERNRGDWNDGSHYAEIGIDQFTVETEDDKYILEELTDLVENWDGDGRVFRDCKWNYSVLYSMVADTVMADYMLLQDYLEN